MEQTCIDYLEKLSPKTRAEAWRVFTKLSKFIVMKKQSNLSAENISILKNTADEFNAILLKEGVEQYFDTSISDDDFITFLTNEFEAISKRKHLKD